MCNFTYLRRFSYTLLYLSAVSVAIHTCQAAPNAWSSIARPKNLPLAIYGSASNGCITGAEQLPTQGFGYQTMRQSRNRHYGHPNLIQFVEALGSLANSQHQLLLLGDMSQAMGGPMSSEHASHQSGLDIDVWLYDMTPKQFKPAHIEQLKMQSTVDKANGQLNTRWRSFFMTYIKHAAQNQNVERIFVNPVIKQALCNIEPNGQWLQKIRPWWGHDSHFHVRLKCPAGQTYCQNSTPIPTGTGCDANLRKWVLEQSDAILNPKSIAKSSNSKISKKQKPPLPVQCINLIHSL